MIQIILNNKGYRSSYFKTQPNPLLNLKFDHIIQIFIFSQIMVYKICKIDKILHKHKSTNLTYLLSKYTI